MYFSPATIALVASLGLGIMPGQVSAVAVDQSDALVERGFFDWFGGGSKNLCDKPNYGASGRPWDSHSTPGAYCGTKKPSNSGAWAQIPFWDGGDTVKCKSVFSRWGLNVCGSGNKRTQLPWGCRPPHSRPRPNPKPSSVKPSASASPSITSVPVVVSSVLADGNVTTSTTLSPSVVQVSPSATIDPSSAASPSTSAVDTDPYADPVCQSTYQVQYEDYKIIAPNGYWMGQLVGAAPRDDSYMTYTLADTVEQCLKACDNIEGCKFVNSYYDFNEDEAYLPKHAPGVLTCAMFSKCVGTEKNDNFGGQDDPNQIKNSNGYCKSGACGGA